MTPRKSRSGPYLLAGFARCACCGGGFTGHSRSHGQARAHFHGCTSHSKRGTAVCQNNLVGRQDAIDAEVLAVLEQDVLRASVIEQAIASRSRRCTCHSGTISGRPSNASGRPCRPSASGSLRLQAWADRWRRWWHVYRPARRTSPSWTPPYSVEAGERRQVETRAGWERRLRDKLADVSRLLRSDLDEARNLLRTLLVGPLRFTPVVDERRRGYRFEGAIALDRLVSGIVDLPTGVASPTGTDCMQLSVDRWIAA
ncbi:zinc ribbon domain-containing protein [Luteitalea pratensis]|uniref:zinc ribbon domain-containing protein n=1 Tax=Luteitalea pratensis TaxID=1855912 RepID=UPI000D729FA7|nr:zinc ribbon domain-containing protein [Luteitalea pratensis]